MRVPPQVSDRIKEAPAQALRGVFAGIGQVLLITDKLRNKTPGPASYARAPQPADPRPVSPVSPTPSAVPSAPSAAPVRAAVVADQAPEVRDFDQTGNVRLLTSEPEAPLFCMALSPAWEASMFWVCAPRTAALERLLTTSRAVERKPTASPMGQPLG